jgi:hypothetical protein
MSAIRVFAEDHNAHGTGPRRWVVADRGEWNAALERDAAAVPYDVADSMPPAEWVTATDEETGAPVEVAPSSCGLRCRCSAAWREVSR